MPEMNMIFTIHLLAVLLISAIGVRLRLIVMMCGAWDSGPVWAQDLQGITPKTSKIQSFIQPPAMCVLPGVFNKLAK